MKTVFFYGLFMDAALLRAKGLAPRHVRLSRLDGYGLRIGERATLQASPGECCYGTIMQLDDAEIEALYSDGSVAEYRPVGVEVRDADGTSVPAICYLLPMSQLSGSNPDYAEKLATVAVTLGLPDEFVMEIETWIRNRPD